MKELPLEASPGPDTFSSKLQLAQWLISVCSIHLWVYDSWFPGPSHLFPGTAWVFATVPYNASFISRVFKSCSPWKLSSTLLSFLQKILSLHTYVKDSALRSFSGTFQNVFFSPLLGPHYSQQPATIQEKPCPLCFWHLPNVSQWIAYIVMTITEWYHYMSGPSAEGELAELTRCLSLYM